MIVSASYKTDIPAYYGAWFLRRLREGWCEVANPYGGKPFRVELGPGAADGFVFWTRNPGPFLDTLAIVKSLTVPFMIQMTITGYPRAIEAGTLDPEAATALFCRLASLYGGRTLVWRYDPILLSDLTPPAWHRATFQRLASALSGATDEVTVSFLQPYRKTARNLSEAGRRHGFVWHDPEPEEKRALLAELVGIARHNGMRLTLCTQPDLADVPGAEPARCIDAVRLSDIADRPLTARTKGNRTGCLCAESRDIGAYETCAQGCAYCYAVTSRASAQKRLRAHDPAGPQLFPTGHRPAAPS